jgi:hypothetical protein
MNYISVVKRGNIYTNVTPHSITLMFEDGEEFEVEPSGIVLNAAPKEEKVTEVDGINYVKTAFIADKEDLAKAMELAADGAVVIGSIIAAQAYKPYAVAMIPAKGYERVPIAEKKMRADKFTVY